MVSFQDKTDISKSYFLYSCPYRFSNIQNKILGLFHRKSLSDEHFPYGKETMRLHGKRHR
jgi:hypothetical protein